MRRLPRVEPTGDDLPPGCRLWRAVGVCNACVFEGMVECPVAVPDTIGRPATW